MIVLLAELNSQIRWLLQHRIPQFPGFRERHTREFVAPSPQVVLGFGSYFPAGSWQTSAIHWTVAADIGDHMHTSWEKLERMSCLPGVGQSSTDVPLGMFPDKNHDI